MTYATRILKDSLAPCGKRLTTWELTYPRFVHAELMTHRLFSRNSASSRAIPINKLIERVETDPVLPIFWGKNQSGMQAAKPLDPDAAETAQILWLQARDQMLAAVRRLSELGLHKQLANRLIEPWMFITVIVSATEYANWFHLRNHKDAQPEIAWVAKSMWRDYQESIPQELPAGGWHLPLINGPETDGLDVDTLKKISVGRVARVSYLTHEGVRDISKDIELHDRLCSGPATGEPGHWCYDDNTEVLTRLGWRRWADVSDESQLAAVNIDTHTINFQTPRKLIKAKYCGDLYSVRGQQVDLLVTPDHRMVVSSRRSGGSWTPFRFECAFESSVRPRKYLKSGLLGDRHSWNNVWGLPSRTFARFIGFFVGDGCAEGGNQALFNIRLVRKVKFLQSIGVPWRKVKKGYVVDLPGIGNWLLQHCYHSDGHKKFPDAVMELTFEEVEALFDGLTNSDGSRKRRTWIYDTCSPYLRDDIQALLHLNGQVGSVSVRCREGTSDCYRMNVSQRTKPSVEVGQTGRSLSYEIGPVPYDGMVYCAEVSTGALLVRRNWKVVVSGNSPFEHIAQAVDKPEHSGNFIGFKQYRKDFEHEHFGGKMP